MYWSGEDVGFCDDIRDRESANAANDKVLEFVQASLLDLDLGDPEIIGISPGSVEIGGAALLALSR